MAGRNTQGSRILHAAGTGSPGDFNEIEEVTNISGPDGTANTIDVTHLRSTAKEYLPGLGDFGQLQLTCNYVGAPQQIALLTMFQTNADPEEFRLYLPVDSTQTNFDRFTFDASVTQWQLGATVDDKQTLNMTLKITGSVVLAQAQPVPSMLMAGPEAARKGAKRGEKAVVPA